MENNIEVKVTDSPKKLAKRVAKAIAGMIHKTGQERIHIALSGGTTPRILFERLALKYSELPEWNKVHLWWGDERCVDPGSGESNFRMTEESLFSKVSIPKDNIHRIRGEAIPEEEALRYEEEIKRFLDTRDELPVFDLVLLGLGEDGHTASLFPDQLELLHSDKLCSVAIHPQSGQKRITLTGKVINNANEIFFMVTGTGKARRVSEIMNNLPEAKRLPAYHILPLHGRLTWYLDTPASEMI
jgi:6-phosphogluconolactonase